MASLILRPDSSCCCWQDVLEKLRPLHPLPGLILEWRRITNALTKVVFPLQREKKHHSTLSMDRIYPTAQTHTATGDLQHQHRCTDGFRDSVWLSYQVESALLSPTSRTSPKTLRSRWLRWSVRAPRLKTWPPRKGESEATDGGLVLEANLGSHRS